jgi:non-ribosomal peptide synthetase component F
MQVDNMVQLAWFDRNIQNVHVPSFLNDLSLSEIFLHQAALHKARPAVITLRRILNYGELVRDATSLAAYLQHQGVVAGTSVAILLPPGIEHVTCQVAILLAGGCILPLDPMLPDDQLNEMLQHSQTVLTISDALTRRRFLDTRYIIFEQVTVADGNELDFTPQRHMMSQATHRLYPFGGHQLDKAKRIDARDLVRQAQNSRHVHFTNEDRVACISSPTGEASLFEIWGALLNGAAAVIIPGIVVNDPARFETALQQFAISILRVPSALFNLIASIRPRSFGQLEYLLVVGDNVNPHSLRRVLRFGPPRHFLYGDGTPAGSKLIPADSVEF